MKPVFNRAHVDQFCFNIYYILLKCTRINEMIASMAEKPVLFNLTELILRSAFITKLLKSNAMKSC